MTKKPRTTKMKSKSDDDALDQVAPLEGTIGRGVSIFTRSQFAASVPEPRQRVKITILSDIRDLKEGRSETMSIWGSTPNMEYVSDALVSSEVRTSVIDFFVGRSLAPVITKAIVPPFVVPNQTALTKPQLYAALMDSGVGLDDRSAQVIMELIMGPLATIGLVSSNGAYSRQEQFPFQRVTSERIAHEIAVHQMDAALTAVSMRNVDATLRQSKHVLAETIAEAFRPVGLALMQAAELASVVDDIIVGVRAHIAPYGMSDKDIDMVPMSWRNNASIAELASCLPFVRAALLYPVSAGTALSLKNEGSNLESWLRVIINYLRDSKRYRWITRQDALRHYTSRKVRNMRGEVTSVVVHRSLKAQPVAQSVIAIKDGAVMELDAVNINATKDRIADVIQATYGAADFSTDAGANLYHSIAADLTSLGYEAASQAIFVDALGEGATMSDIAALIATTLEVEIGEDGLAMTSREQQRESVASDSFLGTQASWDPLWWFGVKTSEKNLPVIAGRHYGDMVITPDPVEAMMAADEITAIEAYPAQPQLLGQAAFNSRLVNFGADSLQNIKAKFGFSLVFGGRELTGAFHAVDFASLRSAVLTRLVKPQFNEAVIRSLSDCYGAVRALISEAGSETPNVMNHAYASNDTVMHSLERRVCIQLLELSQQLSPTFRRDVHGAMIERVLIASTGNTEDLAVTRAQLMQSAFAAIADVTSLLFFLFLQGIECDEWTEIVRSPLMQSVCLEMGSDRKEENAYRY